MEPFKDTRTNIKTMQFLDSAGNIVETARVKFTAEENEVGEGTALNAKKLNELYTAFFAVQPTASAAYNDATAMFEIELANAPDKFDLDKGVKISFVAPADLKAGDKIKITNSKYYGNTNEVGGVWRNYQGIGNRYLETDPNGWYLPTGTHPYIKYIGNGYAQRISSDSSSNSRWSYENLVGTPEKIRELGATLIMQGYGAASNTATSGVRISASVANASMFANITGGTGYIHNGKSSAFYNASFVNSATGLRIIYYGAINTVTDIGYSFRYVTLAGDATSKTLPADYWENDFGTWSIERMGGGTLRGGEWKKGETVELLLKVEGALFNC